LPPTACAVPDGSSDRSGPGLSLPGRRPPKAAAPPRRHPPDDGRRAAGRLPAGLRIRVGYLCRGQTGQI